MNTKTLFEVVLMRGIIFVYIMWKMKYVRELESMHDIWRDTPFCHEGRGKVHPPPPGANATEETPLLDDRTRAKWDAENSAQHAFRSSFDERGSYLFRCVHFRAN